jgi:O-antigen/teichoic acid export membrane protein
LSATKTSYNQIVKSTGLIGGSEIVIIIIKIVKTKLVAILLGPLGVGISGLFDSTLGLVGTITKLGIGFSSIRDIAQAAGTNDIRRISRTLKVLRTWVWFTGILGLTTVVVFSKQLSIWSFGDQRHQISFIILSVVLLVMAISGGQLAILQGLRKISDLAKAKVFGVLMGLFVSIPLYYIYGIDGIIPAIILNSLLALLISWYFSRKINIIPVEMTIKEKFSGGIDMIKLGFFVVVSGLVSTGSLYLVRIVIAQKLGEESVGFFQASWSISTMYIASVLGAMATDYYPRLSAIINDKVQMSKLVNEQTEMALLIAGPLIVGMIGFVHLIILVLYSNKFLPAVPMLEWQLAGTFVKVISWPLGFVLLALGKGNKFVISEALYFASYLLLIYVGWDFLFLEVAGTAFLVAYIIYLAYVLYECRKLIMFSYSRINFIILGVTSVLVIFSFMSSRFITSPDSHFVSGVILIVSIVFSYFLLKKIISFKEIYAKIRNMIVKG